MTWQSFIDLVFKGLPVDANRLGTKTYLDFILRQAVIDIQRAVPFFRMGHETTFGVDDLELVQHASHGVLPAESQIREAYHVSTGFACSRSAIYSYDWSNRYDMITGLMFTNQKAIALDPHGKDFYVWPKIEDGYHVVLIWDGQKVEFSTTDEVPFTEAMALCVSYFIRAHFELEVNKDMYTSQYYRNSLTRSGLYYESRRGLYLDAIKRQRVTDNYPTPQHMYSQSIDALPELNDSEIEFVIIGESGETSTIADTEAVATLVKSLEPDFIIHLGDTNFPDGDPVTIDANFLKYYNAYVGSNTWWQAFGPIDQDTDAGVALLALMPNISDISGENLYYTFTRGPISFFVLDSGTTGDDDYITTSGQETWLEEQLEASNSKWNIVIVTKPPYSSDVNATPGVTETRLSYKLWGADLVISAGTGNYERFLVEGLHYVVNGLGGITKTNFYATPTTGSQVRYNSKHGCLRITANSTRMQVTFMDVNKTIIDRYALTQ